MIHLNNFLSLKLKEVSKWFYTEDTMNYMGFYSNVPLQHLQEIFAIFHVNLNELFSFLNDKNRSNKHYNANESRELIRLSDQINSLENAMRNRYSQHSFKLIKEYREILDLCKSFLTSNGGSTIPDNFQDIEIIDYMEVFKFDNTIEIKSINNTKHVEKRNIGEGSYAIVYKYKDPHYNHHFAIKKAKSNLSNEENERFKNEYQVLKRLASPYIIKAYRFNEEAVEYTVELADMTLAKYIKQNNNKMKFDQRRALIIQLLNGFEYIHSKDLFHRDLSYHNVLIKKYDDGSKWIKISDFGLVKQLDSTLTRQSTEIKGSLNDISDLKRVGFNNYETRHETYALSQVIYFIITGKQGKYENEKDKYLKKFMNLALNSDKKERFSSIEEMKTYLLQKVFPSIRGEC